MSLGRRIARYFTGGDLLGREKYPKVVGINYVLLSSLATGLLKITTGTGIPSIATATDLSSPVGAADAGANDTYTATLAPAPAAYVDGVHYRFKANTANTGAATINFNGLGAKAIKKHHDQDLADGDIESGQWVDLVYDGTNMQMQSGLGNAPTASASGTPFEMEIACSDESTVLVAATGVITFRMPRAITLTGVRASLKTAAASGTFTVDINEAGTTILSTKITIDATEKTSITAATPPVISDASLADDAEMTVDIDDDASGDAVGLKIVLIGTRA